MATLLLYNLIEPPEGVDVRMPEAHKIPDQAMSLWPYLQYRFAQPKRNRTPHDEWIASAAFLKSREWERLRYEALRASDGRCELCGRGKHEGVVLNVDHIKPRAKFPQLA